MRTWRTRLRSWFLLVFLASLMALVIVILVLKPWGNVTPSNVTPANFQKIRIGMTENDLRRLPGPPDYQTAYAAALKGQRPPSWLDVVWHWISRLFWRRGRFLPC